MPRPARPLAGDLLVGNFKDGRINTFDLSGTDLSHNFTPLTDPDEAVTVVSVGDDHNRIQTGATGTTLIFVADDDNDMHDDVGDISDDISGTGKGEDSRRSSRHG